MNLVGKIFVVLVFVMSLVFMSFSVAVYATHRNWRDEVMRTQDQVKAGQQLGLKHQVAQKDTQIKDLEAMRQRLENEKANEIAERQRAISKLEAQLKQVSDAHAQLVAKEADLLNQANVANTAMEATQNTLKALREEVAGLREQIDEARTQRDTHQKTVVELEDQLAQARGEWERLRRRNEELVKDVSRLQLALSDAQIQLDRTGPPRLEGLVLASRESGYVEISLGSDDGLEKGHELDVFRVGPSTVESKYLGRIRIVQTEADKSVGQVIPSFQKGTIQKEDRVATRLR